MYTRFIAPLCCAAAIAFACGPRSQASADAFAARPGPFAGAGHAGARAGTVSSMLSVRVEGGVQLELHVMNKGVKRTEVNFPSGQMYDFFVLDSAGKEVWRWSTGRLFTQSLQNRLLDAGETLTFEEEWDAAGAHGPHTAVATLTSENFPMERRVPFVLP